jgi:hypothetical protein
MAASALTIGLRMDPAQSLPLGPDGKEQPMVDKQKVDPRICTS